MSYTCIEINQVQLIRMFLFFDKQFIITFITFEDIKSNELVIFSSSLISFSIQSCRSCYAPFHLCQRSFNKLFVKVRNSKKNVLKIVLIIVNINKDENKSLISNQFSLKNGPPPYFLENYFAEVKTTTNHF